MLYSRFWSCCQIQQVSSEIYFSNNPNFKRFYFRNENEIDVGLPNARVGTRRYMAPEVLDNTMNTRDFNSYLQADVYSFSLVLWELCRRTRTGKEKESFEDCQLPYYEYLHNRADPSFEDMEVVIIKEVKTKTWS